MILALSLPVLIVMWMIVGEAYKKVEEQTVELQLQNARHFMEYYRSQQDDMINSAINLGTTKRFVSSTIEQHPYNEVVTIEDMGNYMKSFSAAQKGYIYFKGKDYVIGSMAKYRKNIFLGIFPGIDEQMSRQLVQVLDEEIAGRSVIISNFDRVTHREATMLVCVPMSVTSRMDAVFIYQLSYDSLNASVLGALGSNYYGLYIFDENDRPLIYNQNMLEPVINDGTLNAYLQDRRLADFSLFIDDTEYGVFKQYDPTLKMTFMIVSIRADFESPVQSFYQLFRVAILVLVAVLLVLFIMAIYVNYKPILQVTKRIRTYEPSPPDAGEIETINLVLDKKVSENEAMLEKIAEQKLLLTEYTIKALLDGNPVTQEDLLKAGIELPGPYFIVMTLSGISLDNTEQMELSERLYDETGCALSIAQSVYENNYIIITSLPEGSRGQRGGLAKAILRDLDEMTGESDCRIGLGAAENQLDRVRSSYLGSQIAAEQESAGRMVYYEDCIQMFNSFETYPSEEVLRFLQFVKQGEADAAQQEFRAVIQYITKNVGSHLVEQYICHDIVNIFIKVILKLEIPLAEHDTRDVLMFQTVVDLQGSMPELIDKVCKEISLRRQDSGRRLMERVTQYIDEHYDNPNINLPMVADQFDMSIYTLSSIFNEMMGMSFRVYIVNRRIEESKRLLLSTEMSVKEVAFEVGFRDVSYFIKLFKKDTGVTPNKFKQ